MSTIVWFRRDLRLADHAPLRAACAMGEPVLPVFIWDPEEEGADARWPTGAASRVWLHHSLASLGASLALRGSRLLLACGPTAVVLDAGSAAECPVAALVVRNPYATYARIAQLLHPAPAVAAGRHPSAVVEEGAHVDASACVGALAHVAAGATIGPRAFVGPGSVVLAGAQSESCQTQAQAGLLLV